MTRVVLAVLIVVGGVPAAMAQTDRPREIPLALGAQASTITTEAAAIARVRDLFYRQDYVGGAREGAELARRFPASRQLRAWSLVNAARADGPDEALAAADSMIAANRADAWGWFARSIALQYLSDETTVPLALAASLEAYKRLPSNADVQWVRGFTLMNEREYDWTLAFMDSVAKRYPRTPDLDVLYADAATISLRASRTPKPGRLDSVLALFARVRAQHPENASAYSHGASALVDLGGSRSEAYQLAKRGIELEPASRVAHQALMSAIRAQKDRSDSSRYAEQLADIDRLLALRGTSAIVMYGLSQDLGDIRQPARQRELEDRLITEFPKSASVEWTLTYRNRALATAMRDPSKHDTTIAALYGRGLWGFVDRPDHRRPMLLGEAYLNLFSRVDSATAPDTLLRIVRGMAKYEQINPHISYAAGAIALADRGLALPEAEAIARAGDAAGKKTVAAHKSIYETVGEYARGVDVESSIMSDALGWVYFREGRVADAKRELLHARDLNGRNGAVLFHLGEIARQEGDLAGAEQFYIKGALVPGFDARRNRAALQTLFTSRTGSAAGYDAYLAGIEELDRTNRRADVVKSRDASPRAVKAFKLKSLTGEVVSPASLKGKVVVINHWYMGCGPCVAEMPEFQKLAASYASDTTVRILTIDNDGDVTALKKWMQAKGYSFTTLIDDGYMTRTGIKAWPTTWFIDPQGRIAFTKVGSSEKLIEEFNWRIDMIRNPSSMP